LRLYSSPQEVLIGFDLGSSAVGYDGKKVFFTSLGKLSYEYMVNVLYPSRRSTTYEERLVKYYKRGFSIVLPKFDISKLRTNYFKYNLVEVEELPYFTFSYNKVVGNKIYFVSLIREKHLCQERKSDYQDEQYDEYNIFYLNLKNLAKGGDSYYYSSSMNLDILTNPPYITNSRIINYYDSLIEKIYHGCMLNVKAFALYFPEESLPRVVEELYVKKNITYLSKLVEAQKK